MVEYNIECPDCKKHNIKYNLKTDEYYCGDCYSIFDIIDNCQEDYVVSDELKNDDLDLILIDKSGFDGKGNKMHGNKLRQMYKLIHINNRIKFRD
jgi:hypothetical protein